MRNDPLADLKSYLRSTMTEERLSGLALLSIERQFATELDYDKVMDYFAKMKPDERNFCRTVQVQRRYFLKNCIFLLLKF